VTSSPDTAGALLVLAEKVNNKEPEPLFIFVKIDIGIFAPCLFNNEVGILRKCPYYLVLLSLIAEKSDGYLLLICEDKRQCKRKVN